MGEDDGAGVAAMRDWRRHNSTADNGIAICGLAMWAANWGNAAAGATVC